MTNTAINTQYADIARIIQGKPAVSFARLPRIWQDLANGQGTDALSANARADYAEAAQLFMYHGTPLAIEAMESIAADFDAGMYPDLEKFAAGAKNGFEASVINAVSALFAEFGREVPASFYNVILATGLRDDMEKLMGMFKNKDALMQDRLWDAVLHAMLLVTPIGLRVQSVMSQHGLRFVHVMNCGCNIHASGDASFEIALDPALKPAYLQNLVAAAFEQYGVNAATSRMARGF